MRCYGTVTKSTGLDNIHLTSSLMISFLVRGEWYEATVKNSNQYLHLVQLCCFCSETLSRFSRVVHTYILFPTLLFYSISHKLWENKVKAKYKNLKWLCVVKMNWIRVGIWDDSISATQPNHEIQMSYPWRVISFCVFFLAYILRLPKFPCSLGISFQRGMSSVVTRFILYSCFRLTWILYYLLYSCKSTVSHLRFNRRKLIIADNLFIK